ncbi:MAG: 1-deoxy-D-xylulose-5-phosphate reductoisomerase [Clostridia bacterium]|nr:1-deoxy-D-xylulose-5-phosphate reductoisomerase [Clostridia bacterium]
MIQKRVAILGSTGSVGSQICDVCERCGAKIVLITANANTGSLERQIRKYGPEYCAVSDEKSAKELAVSVSDTGTKIISGYDAMCDIVGQIECDIVYNAISGKNGLLPTLASLSSGKTLALANKESMVLAGDIVNACAKEHGAEILPVDSEHCAIFQCLRCGKHDEVKRILLTASGGPFFGYSYERLEKVTLREALLHPTWSMGKKITVDSATLANKGLEIIEAMHLFGVPYDRIKVLIHRQSIVHSMVQFVDNSVIAQLSVPDMRHPGQYALTYPDRCDGVIPELDLTKHTLTFAEPDTDAFRMLGLAQYCAQAGGLLPCAYNAANEAAVDLFLKERIGFNDVYRITENVISKTQNEDAPSLQSILECDRESRGLAYSYKEIISSK